MNIKKIAGWFLALCPFWLFILWCFFFAITELIFCIIVLIIIYFVILVMIKGIKIIKGIDDK